MAALRFAALSFAALSLAGCARPAATGDPVRLAALLPPAPPEPLAVAGAFAVGPQPLVQPVKLEAARVDRLRVRVTSRDAELIRLSWRLAEERRQAPYRALTFPVQPDGEEHVYDVDLRREPYWTGHVVALAWQSEGGSAQVAEVVGRASADAGRVTSLRGLTLPSLPGAARLEIELPDGLPKRATFEVRLGLLPRFDEPSASARFRAWTEGPGGGGPEALWLDEVIHGELAAGDAAGDDGRQPAGGAGEAAAKRRRQKGGAGWRPVRREVELPRAGGKLVLEVSARRGGRPLPEGSAVWGDPLLVPPAAGEPPADVIVVVIDTLRADVLGAYGGEGGLTPNLDALAARSLRFDDLSAPSPWTLPSIATLITGEPPEVHGAGRRVGDYAPTALDAVFPTLAERLAGDGFYTAGVYNNIYINPSFGMEQGFDEYAWYEAPDDVLVDRALERLAALRDRRTFLFLHLFGPHQPYEPPDRVCRAVVAAYAADDRSALGCSYTRTDVPTLSGELPPAGDRRHVEGLYRAEVAFSDRQVGRLLSGLDDLGLADHTLLLVVGDHGESFWDRLEQEKALGYAHADHGHTHYQELVRVPGILHVPGRESQVVTEPVEMADLLPTLLALLHRESADAAGAEVEGWQPPRVTGHDLTPLLDGEPAGRRTILSDLLLYGPSRWAVRRGPWKLIVPREDDLPVELYDLSQDPAEVHDLAADRSDVVAALRAYGERELERRDKLRRRVMASDEDVLNAAYLEWNHITRLRALGYLK